MGLPGSKPQDSNLQIHTLNKDPIQDVYTGSVRARGKREGEHLNNGTFILFNHQRNLKTSVPVPPPKRTNCRTTHVFIYVKIT